MSASKTNENDTVKNMEGNDVVCWHNKSCQTKDVKWLLIENVHDRLHRPNFYEIGSTFISDVLDFTFTAKVERVGGIILLHIFVGNKHEGDFAITINDNSDLSIDKKNKKAFLSLIPKQVKFAAAAGEQSYLVTYSFTDLDLEFLINKKLYIAACFTENSGVSIDIVNNVKTDHDFRNILEESIGCDFTVESAEGKKFQVHKSMLAVHTDVFKAMLKEDTAESQNNYVLLGDVGKEDLQCILEFIYTGAVAKLENKNCFNLLMLADRYDLKGLRALSQHALAQQLNLENALEVLMVADMYNSDDLKYAALKFIKKNISELKTSIFKEINNIALMRELCGYLVIAE